MSDINIKVNIVSTGAQSSIKALTRDTQKLEQGVEAVNVNVKNTTSAFKVFAGVISGQAIISAVRNLTTGMTEFAKSSIQAASDAAETASKFAVVFRSVGDEAEKGAERLTTSFGLSRNEAKDLLSATGDLLTGFGFTGRSALSLSQQVQELSVDLASFTNFSGGAKGASEALTKALLGERESVKALGISILEEDVKKQVAINTANGLIFATERQAKAQATLDIAIRQSQNAIGDYARTSDGFANKQRELDAVIKNITETIGAEFLPILTEIIKETIDWARENEKLIQSFAKDAASVFKQIVESVKSLIGFVQQAVQYWNEYGDVIIKVGKAVAAGIILLAAFEAGLAAIAIATTIATGGLNLLPIAIVAIGAAVAVLIQNFDNLVGNILVFSSIILQALQPIEDKFKSISASILRTWANTIGFIIQGAIDLASSLGEIFGITLPEQVTGFKQSLLDAADSIENSKSVTLSLAQAVNQQAQSFKSASTASTENTDAINTNTEAKKSNIQTTNIENEAIKNNALEAENAAKRKAAAEALALKAKEEAEARKKEIDEATRALNEQIVIEEEDLRAVKAEADLVFIEEQLGHEEAVKTAARQRELEAEGNHALARLELEKKLTDAQNKELITREAKAKEAAKKQEELDKTVAKNRINIASGLGNLLTALGGKFAKAGFIITKGAALAESIVNTQVAATLALRSAPPPIGAALAAQVTLAGRLNTAAIAASTVQGFQAGGIVAGSSLTGDRVPAVLNSGEAVLNRSQQSELLGLANGNRSQQGGQGQEIVVYTNVNVDGETVARAVSRQVADGFKLGEVV